MSLLQNEDFTIWQLRTSYLANVKDGVGERLIHVNSSVLNHPAFRSAGWNSNSADSKRTYSPPIPTAATSDYFSVPARVRGHANTPGSIGEEEEEGGMVTGAGSNDTIAPGPNLRRRRKREQVDEDDSSDLSDESDDDVDGPQRAAQQIKFAKMPVRNRAGSSPIQTLDRHDGPELLVTSPSRRSTDSRFRRGSLGAVEAVKARARRDTATSSEMSSENELDPSVFHRRQVRSRAGTQTSNPLTPKVDEEEPDLPQREEPDDVDSEAESDGSGLSSEFGETMEAGSLLESVAGLQSSSPMLSNIPSHPPTLSPKKSRTLPSLQDFPPARPISVISPVSLLGSAIRATKKAPTNPTEGFASLSGKASPNPLYIKIYAPFSERSRTPFEMLAQRTTRENNKISVADAIGLSLWKYGEEGLKPLLPQDMLNVNRWTLRIVEDGEVDFDFPALSRTKPMVDFTSNNNRGVRARSREKPWDEFALVEATPQQTKENEKLTPFYNPVSEFAETSLPQDSSPQGAPAVQSAGPSRPQPARSNQVLSQPFSSALNNPTTAPADRPEPQKLQATPRLGRQKTLRIRYLDLEASTQTVTMDIGVDSYIAEVLDYVCKRWNLEKALFTLRVSGTSTVAPLDRTVEALGERSELDLVRKRFLGGSYSLTGSPGSSSPNAPLLIDIDGPKKGRRGHPLAQKQDIASLAGNYKRFNVIRKTNLSFSQANQRILTFDGEYMHILPAETGRTLFETSSKSTSIAWHDVLGCKGSKKHHKIVRLAVARLNETKRYDFEARNASEAAEIVEEIKKNMTARN